MRPSCRSSTTGWKHVTKAHKPLVSKLRVSSSVMAGLVPAIPILNGAALKTIEITGTRGDDGGQDPIASEPASKACDFPSPLPTGASIYGPASQDGKPSKGRMTSRSLGKAGPCDPA
jgi:hypothetical protein